MKTITLTPEDFERARNIAMHAMWANSELASAAKKVSAAREEATALGIDWDSIIEPLIEVLKKDPMNVDIGF